MDTIESLRAELAAEKERRERAEERVAREKCAEEWVDLSNQLLLDAPLAKAAREWAEADALANLRVTDSGERVSDRETALRRLRRTRAETEVYRLAREQKKHGA